MKTPRSIFIIVDNFRIGGIQRNALDQMCALKQYHLNSCLIILNKDETIKYPNFFMDTKNHMESFDIKYINNNIISRFFFFFKLAKKSNDYLFIDYSLRSTPILRVIRYLKRSNFKIHTVIQQFASLSKPSQRFKRFLYSEFSTTLFINSVNYQLDWINCKNINFIYKKIFRKYPLIIRNGIYFQRLSEKAKQIADQRNESKKKSRLVYLGRMKKWKGIETFQDIALAVGGRELNLLLISPEIDSDMKTALEQIKDIKIELEIGKPLENVALNSNDINIYPVQYGESFQFSESISTNCLEMAYLGLPSLVSKNHRMNWPELVAAGMLFEVDWKDSNSIVEAINKCHKYFNQNLYEKFLVAVDINSNIQHHLSYYQISS
jgi:glycosyltransferase involved in cell wall biosynthesis